MWRRTTTPTTATTATPSSYNVCRYDSFFISIVCAAYVTLADTATAAAATTLAAATATSAAATAAAAAAATKSDTGKHSERGGKGAAKMGAVFSLSRTCQWHFFLLPLIISLSSLSLILLFPLFLSVSLFSHSLSLFS
jgi:hypothetical protein